MKPLTLCWIVVVAGTVACGGSDGRPADGAAAATQATAGPVDACRLFTQADLAELVGNPVTQGEHFAGSEVCKWGTEQPAHVSVLLTVRPKGSLRERAICPDEVGKATGGGPLTGVGDKATWKFGSTMGMFNSGDLESCSAAGYINISLNGERDESTLKKAATMIANRVISR
jgi:hypothetical protein